MFNPEAERSSGGEESRSTGQAMKLPLRGKEEDGEQWTRGNSEISLTR